MSPPPRQTNSMTDIQKADNVHKIYKGQITSGILVLKVLFGFKDLFYLNTLTNIYKTRDKPICTKMEPKINNPSLFSL